MSELPEFLTVPPTLTAPSAHVRRLHTNGDHK